jgi:3-deoxy-D-manno-octulosonic-acid transferase
LSLLLYNLLFPLALLAMLPSALRKLRERGGNWSDLRQRIGLLDTPQRTALASISHYDQRFWFHAVSVGEVGVALKLIAPLLKRSQNAAVVLTTTTPTGHQIASNFAAKQNGRVAILYSPLDLAPVVRSLLLEIAPCRLVLVEAEVWPNLVTQARRLNIPITLANARLSPRSKKRFQRFSFLTRPIFSQLDQVLVQEPEDVTLWAELGANPRHIHLTGSVKYDPEGNPVSPQKLEHFRSLLTTIGIQPGHQPIIIAASTHPGEELALSQSFLTLLQNAPTPTPALLIVPRHFERSPAIVKELTAIGLTPILRSTLTPDTTPRPFSPQHPLLIDTTGELNAWQHLSDIVIIGKSFLAHGGQNPAEAALARKPVILGPHMENFEPLVALLLQAKGAIQAPTVEALPQLLQSLLNDPQQATTLGTSAQNALSRHAGAAQRTLTHLLPQ